MTVHIGPDEFEVNWMRDEEEQKMFSVSKNSSEVLEIKDYYRVWVKSPDNVPDDQQTLYDREGDPAGNHYYYEVPFETKTRVPIDDDIDKAVKEAMADRGEQDYPERIDLVDIGTPEKDLTVVDKAREHVEDDMPLFGQELKKTNPSILCNIESPLTLFHLYKILYEAGGQYEAGLNQIQKELGARGVYAFEKVSKARRYIDSPDEAPADARVQEGERGGLYYETEDGAGESDTDASRGTVSEFASAMEVSEWPEEHAILGEEDLRQETADVWSRADDDVAEHVLNQFNGFKGKAKQSSYRFNENDIVLRPDADEETIAHEFGHATLAGYGFTVNDMGNMIAHFYPNEVPGLEFGEPVSDVAQRLAEERLDQPGIPDSVEEETRENLAEVKDRYEGMELQREDMHVFVPDDYDGEIPEKVQDLAEAVNTAWDRQIDAKRAGMDASEFTIGKDYSATNAHETMAMTHETMQGGVADPTAMETLYRNQQELLDAYTDIFEPADIQKDMLNELYKSFGPNSIWEEVPYPEVEGLLEG